MNLKLFFLVVASLFLLHYQAEARVGLSLGEKEFLEKVADLSDIKELIISDEDNNSQTMKAEGDNNTGVLYADLGILFRQYVIANIPLWTTREPVLVLINPIDENTYYDVSNYDMDLILERHNLIKEKLLDIGFYPKYGGKLLALAILIFIFIGLLKYDRRIKL